MGPLFRNNPETTWAPEAKSGQGRLSPKGPPFIFSLFQGNLQNRTCLKGPPFGFFFGTVRLFFRKKIFNVSKWSPFEFFSYFATECMLINPKGSPFYSFRHFATFLEEKFFFKNYKFFSKKNVLLFLSLRYGADFRRSRLVLFAPHASFT